MDTIFYVIAAGFAILIFWLISIQIKVNNHERWFVMINDFMQKTMAPILLSMAETVSEENKKDKKEQNEETI